MSLIDPFATIGGSGGTVINTFSQLFNLLKQAGNANKQASLIELASPARVEPLTIVSNDCLTVDYLPDVMQSLNAIFAGYYLQAISMVTTLEKVKVVRVLDSLNPNRIQNGFNFGTESIKTKDVPEIVKPNWQMAEESYKYRLPTPDNANAFAYEAEAVANIAEKDFTSITKELANLSVGRLVNVTVRDGEQSIVVPIAIRLLVNQLPITSFDHLLTFDAAEDKGFTERYHAWRAGRINLVEDLMFCQDLIKEHKKALMEDKAGVYTEIVRRANVHKKAGFFSKNPSLASASNLFVMSETVARGIEDKIGGKLNNPRIRDKIFEAGYGMIIAVIDREFDRVTFYHRGIAAPTTMGVRDLKMSNKGNGPDIGEILSAYKLGSAINL